MDSHASIPRLILIEGLPGLGKTSLAECLCSHLLEQGIMCAWEREEANDHPVINSSIRRRAGHPGYGQLCARQWIDYAASIEAEPGFSVHILEGCFLQSTVRFLVEQERPFDETLSYLNTSEAHLARIGTRLIYLTQPEPGEYLREQLSTRKGADVVEKIARYTAATPFARSRGLLGMAALISLYSEYRNCCDTLLRFSQMPRLEIDAVGHDAEAVQDFASAWLVGGAGAA